MNKLTEFRKKYPQYNEISDFDLADALHQKHYSSMDRDDFMSRVGVAPAKEPEPTKTERIDSKIKSQQEKNPLEDNKASEMKSMQDAEEPGFFSNAGRLFADETLSTLGHIIKGGVGRPGQSLTDKADLGTIVFGSDWGEGHPDDGKFRIRYMKNDEIKQLENYKNTLEESVPDKLEAADFGGVDRNNTEDIKREYAEGDVLGTAGAAVKFGIETGIKNAGAMIISALGVPGLVASTAGQSSKMADTRAENKGLEEAGMKEQLEALPFALGSTLFERYGVKKMGEAFGKEAVEEVGGEILDAGLKEAAKAVSKKTGKAFAAEAATEAFQEGVIEYVGEKLGTDAKMSGKEAAERALFGGIAGGVMGGAVGAAGGISSESLGALDRKAARSILNEQPKETELADPRLNREEFRTRLAENAEYYTTKPHEILDDDGAKISEVEPLTPKWAEEINDSGYDITETQIKGAVEKALTGKEMGIKEQKVVSIMLDNMTSERTSEGTLSAAKERLEEARRQRTIERNKLDNPQEITAEEQSQAGELWEESEYLSEMDAEARILDEIAHKAESAGVENVNDIIKDSSSTSEAILNVEKTLEGKGVIDEQKTDQSSIESTTDQTGAATEIEAPKDRRGDSERRESPRDGTTERRQGERRIDAERRAKIENMSLDEIVELVYSNELTGIPNRRAFEQEIGSFKTVASIDADNLKVINDNFGQDAGDGLLKAVARSLKNSAQETDGVEAYHISGDEYYIVGDNEAEVQTVLERAQADLSNQVVEADKGKLEGLNITHGISDNKNDADLAMKAEKAAKEAAGLRAPRGVLPSNAILYSKKPLEMKAGNNHIGSIGKTGDLPVTPNNEYKLGNGKVVNIPNTPIRRQHILNRLQKDFGNKIYAGKVKGKNTLGFYRKGVGEIRSKHTGDLETVSHEFAHWLDDRYVWVGELYKEYESEMKAVSYDEDLDHEGYAEFMRLWFTQEHEARERAPGFYDAWMDKIESKPELRDKLYRTQELMHAWHLQGARQRLEDRVASKPSILERARRPLQNWKEKALQRGLDDIRRFKDAERAITGKVGDAVRSGYSSLRLARGAHGVMEAVMKRGTIAWTSKGDVVFTGKGIRQVFEPVAKKMEDFQLYMISRRAQELRAQERENHIREDEMQAGLRLGDVNPEFKEVFDEYQKFNKRMMDFYQDSGIISEESRASIEEMNKNYVPFNRVVEQATGERTTSGGGTPFMRLKGGTQDINNVFENIVGNTSRMVHMSLINKGKANFYKMIDNADNQQAALFAVPIDAESSPTKVQSDQVIRMVVNGMGRDMGWYRKGETGMFNDKEEQFLFESVQLMADGMGDLVTFWQHGKDPRGKVDYYLENGKKKFYEIGDELLYESIQSLGPRPYNMAMAIMGGFANVLRKGITLTPTFQAKNFIRDTMNAFTLSKGQIIPAASAMKALTERIYNDEHYWEYMANGGGFASMADADGINRDRVVDVGGKIVEKLDKGLSAFEYSNRIAEFKALKKKGLSARDAALAGREISSDFAMRGSSEFLRYFTSSVPFLNARLQGLYRNARELASMEEGKLKFAGSQAFSYGLRSILSITVPSLALYMLVKDDERYQEQPDWVRDLFWFIPTGKGEDEYMLIPKTFETGMIWGTTPERMVEYYYKQDDKELADAMLWMAMQTFNFNMIPQVYKVWDDLEKNKNFTGAPIIPRYLENIEPEEQYRAYTSDAMIALGRKLGVSPMKAEYIVRGHFGTLGTWGLGMADFLVGDINNSGEKPTKGWKDNFLLSPFVNDGPLRRTHSEQNLYDMLNESQKVANTIRLISKRSPERLETYLNEDKKQAFNSVNKALVTSSRQLREIKKAIDVIGAEKDLSGDEKREQIFALQRTINKITREAQKNINYEMIDEINESLNGLSEQ